MSETRHDVVLIWDDCKNSSGEANARALKPRDCTRFAVAVRTDSSSTTIEIERVSGK